MGVDLDGYNSVMKWGLTGTGFLEALLTPGSEDLLAPRQGMELPAAVMKALKELREENCRLRSDFNSTSSTAAVETLLPKSWKSTNVDGSHSRENDGRSYEDVDFCLACARHGQKIVCMHPLFEGFLCSKCKDALMESLFALDDDGCNLFCCICGEGGEVSVCESRDCGKSFCVRCMKRYLSQEALKIVRSRSPWSCFLCSPYHLSTHGILIGRDNAWDMVIKFFNPFTEDCNLENATQLVSNLPKKKLRVLSLFDGIGTVRETLDQLGLEVEAYYASEISCDAELVTMFNHGFSVSQLGDVYNIDRNKLEEICPIDLVIGSPPVVDLDVTNMEYEGFNGTGVLMLKFLLLLKDVQMLTKGSNSVFWLVESTAAMKSEFRKTLTKLFGKEPCMWDAQYFSPYVQPMLYWGNIPELYSSQEYFERHKDEHITLDPCLAANVNRKSMVAKLRNCAIDVDLDKEAKMRDSDGDKVDNSEEGENVDRSLASPGTNFRLPILMNGMETNIWLAEVERVLGFPDHYTDVSRLGVQSRQQLMKRASSVHVLKHLLSPLTKLFVAKD